MENSGNSVTIGKSGEKLWCPRKILQVFSNCLQCTIFSKLLFMIYLDLNIEPKEFLIAFHNWVNIFHLRIENEEKARLNRILFIQWLIQHLIWDKQES